MGSRPRHRHALPCVSHRFYLPPLWPLLKRPLNRRIHRTWREICTRGLRSPTTLSPFNYRDS